jgi:glycosyltransferase involved in cell wall biosynthesis
MRIVLYSRAFRPSIGGLETMMEILAEEFTAAGHQVKVITQVPAENENKRKPAYEIVRLPTLRSCVQVLRWSDVCLCANVSLRGLLPILLAGCPLVISHHGTYGSLERFSFVPELKKTVTRFSNNICCSEAVKSHIPGDSIVIPNTYRSDVFREYSDVSKDLDIVFLGRLVSDKGVPDLIDALEQLNQESFRPRLSIVGDGPERQAISARVEALRIGAQVTFFGAKTGSELGRLIARHRVMVVPSRCAEGFGLVAIEGIACGCAILGTDLGGLPEAIGPCGVTVPSGDKSAMARALKLLLQDENLRGQYRSRAPAHLARHSRPAIARKYLTVLEAAANVATGVRLGLLGLICGQAFAEIFSRLADE